MFQICPVCDMQQDIEPYDVCQACGHEWSIEEIRSSTPVPIERPLTPRVPDVGQAGVIFGQLPVPAAGNANRSADTLKTTKGKIIMSEYVAFGDEWKKHVAKLPKRELVEMLAKALNEKQETQLKLYAEQRAAQQSVRTDPPSACEDCGSVDEHIHYANCPLANTAGR